MRLNDLSGQTFGKWTVLHRAGVAPGSGNVMWCCRCCCGKEAEVTGSKLKNGKSSCCVSCRKVVHGATVGSSRLREYRIWVHMKQRCTNSANVSYRYYGGRGIKVCKRWMKFENFIADMGMAPTNKHTLDRIDNNRGYTRANCRWATSKEQNRNKRSNHPMTYKGCTKLAVEWAEFYGVEPVSIYRRLYLGWDDNQIFTWLQKNHGSDHGSK